MPTIVKDGAAWKNVTAIYYKQNGAWVPVTVGYTKVNGVWVETFASAVTATITATTANVNLSTLFSVADWQNTTKKKIVVIPAGVIVGSSNPAVAALVTGSGMGATLELLISGEVQGAGGTANSGSGGNAINNQLDANQLTIQINSGGAVRSGGGGGGKGGAGTATTLTNREPATGQNYKLDFGSGPNWNWVDGVQISTATDEIYWNSTTRIATPPAGSSVFDTGGYRYFKGTRDGPTAFYGVYRQQISSGPTVGGDGGRGQGYAQTLAAGSAGGTNAGTGGAGGAWGAPGANGTAGNNGSGVVGGTAGGAIIGAARTLVNNGTINGAVI